MIAILHLFGIRYGYFDPKNYREVMYVDPVIETFGEVVSKSGGVFFATTDDTKQKAMDSFAVVAKAFCGLVEKNF